MNKKAVTAAVAIALVGSALGLAFPRGEPDYTVVAEFSKTIGLFSESDVRVLGVSVGRVVEVTPQGERVRVTMEVEGEHAIPSSAVATIVPISLISDRYIQLSPPYSEGPKLRDGDVITAERTTIPYELDDLLLSLKRFLDALEAGSLEDPGALGDAVTNLAAALRGTGGALSRTLEGAGSISSVVNERSTDLDGAITSLSGLVSALSAKRNDIAALNSGLARGLGAVADEQAALEASLRNIALLTHELGDLIRDHRPTLQSDLTSLARLTSSVVLHQESVVRANDWLHVLADGLESSHNQGAVHPVPGFPTHIDVRDAHYGTCPSPFLGCSLVSPTAAQPAAKATTAKVGDKTDPAIPPNPQLEAATRVGLRSPWYVRLGGWIASMVGGRQ